MGPKGLGLGKEQKKKNPSIYWLQLTRLERSFDPPFYCSRKNSDYGSKDLEEVQNMVKSTARDCVPEDKNSFVTFQAKIGVEPCKGILLFGPPGTRKTMLTKAIATEASANFINISMSSITSKWFSKGEKYVKAVFSLASKIAPSDLFVDEVDSILGRRENPGGHEAMCKMKNEFMVNWDGLRTKDT